MSRQQESLRESVPLSTGRACELTRVRNEWIPRYYLLTFLRSQGEPSTKEVSEMVAIGVERAKVLALESVDD